MITIGIYKIADYDIDIWGEVLNYATLEDGREMSKSELDWVMGTDWFWDTLREMRNELDNTIAEFNGQENF